MKKGLLSLRKSLPEFLAFGLGTRSVYFQEDGERRPRLVFLWSQKARAFRCDPCEIVVFPEAQ